MVDYVLVGDLHLGPVSSAVVELPKTLGKMRFKNLILLGDVLSGSSLSFILPEQKAVLDYLINLQKSKNVIWIEGNHDSLLKTLGIKLVREYKWELNGNTYLAFHGHQFDPSVPDNILRKKLSDLINILGYKLKFMKLYDWAFGLLVDLPKRTLAGAVREAKMTSAKYVFCGHSHETQETEVDGVKYFNPGCWVGYRANPAIITIDKDGVKLVPVKNAKRIVRGA